MSNPDRLFPMPFVIVINIHASLAYPIRTQGTPHHFLCTFFGFREFPSVCRVMSALLPYLITAHCSVRSHDVEFFYHQKFTHVCLKHCENCNCCNHSGSLQLNRNTVDMTSCKNSPVVVPFYKGIDSYSKHKKSYLAFFFKVLRTLVYAVC